MSLVPIADRTEATTSPAPRFLRSAATANALRLRSLLICDSIAVLDSRLE